MFVYLNTDVNIDGETIMGGGCIYIYIYRIYLFYIW